MPARPLTQLAQRLRRLAHDEARNVSTSIERWSVTQGNPLIIEELEGDLVLEEGDPDFVLGDTLRKYRASNALVAGDQVMVVHSGHEWHALDVVTARTAWEP